MNEIININGIECYEKDGVVYLKLETVARGLGFIRDKNGVEYVMWDRVNKYLSEIGFHTCVENENGFLNKLGKDEFIPENIFYRLAMKAKNETAEAFQAKVADEIIPSVRKHGAYITTDTIDKMIASPEFGIKLLTALKEEQEKNKKLQKKVEEDAPKVTFADAVSCSEDLILIRELAKLLKQNGIDTGEKRLYKWLRENKYLIKHEGTDYNTPTQRSMDLGLFEIQESVFIRADGSVKITKTTKVTGRGQQYFINKFLSEGILKI